MNFRIFPLLLLSFLLVDHVHPSSISKRGNEVFKLLKETKEKVKHGTQCLPPSKYFAGSCYTYMKFFPATSWDGAHNNCLSLPLTKDARLLVIDSIAEYEFVDRELIGPKWGPESVSVYVGLRKINGTWLWSNDVSLKETSIYRFWVDNNKDILAYDCGVLWFSQNSSVLMAAPCAEQAPRPYVCKHTIDYCYNNSGGCGKYGTCLNLPLLNTHKCQCRFLYAGDRCEKWSSQGLQAVIGSIIVVITFIVSYVINLDRSNDRWSFRKSTAEHYQANCNSIYGQSRPQSYLPCTPTATDRILLNPCLPPSPGLINTSTPNEKRWRHSSSSSPPPLPPPLERKHRYSFRLSVQELEVTSHLRDLFRKPKRLILIILPITLTIIISIIIVHSRHYIKENLLKSSFQNSTRLFQFCSLYENHYYVNLITLPMALVILLIIVFNNSRTRYCRSGRHDDDGSEEKFSLYVPIPYNPFSKVNRFDTMVIWGIASHEIFQIIEGIFLKSTDIKSLTLHGPLFDLVRQIGLVIIIGLRYLPVYCVIEMANANILYYALCAVYVWIDLVFRVVEQSYCVNVGPLIKTWHRLKQFKQELAEKLATQSLLSTTMMMNTEHNDLKSGGSFKAHLQRFRERSPIKRLRPATTTILPALQLNSLSVNPTDSMNWSSIYLNLTSSIDRNESQSTFDQFNIDSATIGILKYAPYYLCLTYICIRLTYLCFSKISHLFPCWNRHSDPSKPFSTHIYHEPDLKSSQNLSVEYRYVRHLFQKTNRILIGNKKKISFFKSLLYKIYRPNKYFHYSKQILNMYMIAFMLTYYLTFNILQGGFYIIEKIYSILAIPLIVLSDEFDLPAPNPFNLKYEMIVTCLLTASLYYGQLLWGMKNYQKHMLNAYQGKFIDIPPRTAFRSARLISQHAHYSGYCIAYLGFAYITMGNVLFITIIVIRMIFKQLFLLEQLAKVVIPVLVIYLSKYILTWFLSRTFFLQRHGTTIALKNLRGFFVFCYFNFFFDCFLGIVSCALRVSKASTAAVLFLPRLDYCIFGRALEKLDTGFISYVSFIHMECLHTHPVLIFYCSAVNEKIVKRYQHLKSNKRDLCPKEMYEYTRSQRAKFRWWLAYTLVRNTQLVQLRKSQIIHLQLVTAESFNEFLERKVWNRFHTAPTLKFSLSKSQRTLQTGGGSLDSNTIIRNQTTGCTTLLLDSDEQDDRRPGF